MQTSQFLYLGSSMGLLNIIILHAPLWYLQGTSTVKAGFLLSIHPRWGLIPKEPLLSNSSPTSSLAVKDLASELVPAGSFLTTVLLKKLCVLTTVTVSTEHARGQCHVCTLSLPVINITSPIQELM